MAKAIAKKARSSTNQVTPKASRLIIEKMNGVIYAYRENEAHFQKVDKNRTTERIEQSHLDTECNLDCYDDFHMVFDLKQ